MYILSVGKLNKSKNITKSINIIIKKNYNTRKASWIKVKTVVNTWIERRHPTDNEDVPTAHPPGVGERQHSRDCPDRQTDRWSYDCPDRQTGGPMSGRVEGRWGRGMWNKRRTKVGASLGLVGRWCCPGAGGRSTHAGHAALRLRGRICPVVRLGRGVQEVTAHVQREGQEPAVQVHHHVLLKEEEEEKKGQLGFTALYTCRKIHVPTIKYLQLISEMTSPSHMFWDPTLQLLLILYAFLLSSLSVWHFRIRW